VVVDNSSFKELGVYIKAMELEVAMMLEEEALLRGQLQALHLWL
jgi:hypothetical protein